VLEISEIFASLQGEGPFAGRPAVFIRLAGCMPPFCEWCDTPQALGQGRPMSARSVLEEIERSPGRLVVVTGGEPFRQWETGLDGLVRDLVRAGRRVQYETSGKAGIPADHDGFVVCSPKPAHEPRLAPDDAARVDAFKFVVDDDPGPVLRFVDAHGIDPSRVWLMPLGARRHEQELRMAAVWEHCVRHGFNFSPRLHILAFDNKQGV
jgi:7-carboxy-7-deazaguanine synthase